MNNHSLSSPLRSAHLREGAVVLVDEEDQKDFEDILAGRTVEPKGRV